MAIKDENDDFSKILMLIRSKIINENCKILG